MTHSSITQFFSWSPNPLALAMDILLQDWAGMEAYVKNQWNLIGRIM